MVEAEEDISLQESKPTSEVILKKSSRPNFPNLVSLFWRNLKISSKNPTSQGSTRPPLHSNPNSSSAFFSSATNTGRFRNRAGIRNRRRSVEPTYTAIKPEGMRRVGSYAAGLSESEQYRTGRRRMLTCFQRSISCFSRTIWLILWTTAPAIGVFGGLRLEEKNQKKKKRKKRRTKVWTKLKNTVWEKKKKRCLCKLSWRGTHSVPNFCWILYFTLLFFLIIELYNNYCYLLNSTIYFSLFSTEKLVMLVLVFCYYYYYYFIARVQFLKRIAILNASMRLNVLMINLLAKWESSHFLWLPK